jgi:hypothetical protein
MRRFVLLPILVVLALLAASCGGSSGSSSGAATSAGASIAPASAPAYVMIDTDPGSAQWKQADALLGKFPGKQKLLDAVDKALAKQGVSYEQDIKPALGPEVDFAVLSLAKGSRAVVGMVQPTDKAKLQALLDKLDKSDPTSPKTVTGEYKGWTLVSDKQSAIDTFKSEAAKGSIADDATFKEAMAKDQGDALVKAYANGSALGELVGQAATQAGTSCNGAATTGGVKLRYVSGAASVEADGVRVHATLRSDGAKSSGGGSTATLLDEIPSGALAVLAFHGTDQFAQGFSQLQGCGAQIQQGLGLVEGVLGVKVKDLASLFKNEVALYVRAGSPIPEVTLLSHQDDPKAALATIDSLATHIGSLVGGGAPHATTVDGAPVKEITVGGGVASIFYGVIAGKVVVTDSRTGIHDLLQSGGAKLRDDAAFKSSRKASGMPDDTPFFLYADIRDSVTLVESLAQLAGAKIPPSADANLRPLKSLVVYAAGPADDVEYTAFLELQ